jgi:gliding-associated putative ABC transporter substrate-binding component GldG
LVSYNGFERGVTLLKGSRAQPSQEVINQSIEGVEFELANAINKLSSTARRRVGLITGHGELDSLALAGLNNALLEQYDVFRVDLSRKKIVSNYDVLIIAKPTRSFSENDKFKLDQFIMKGGKVLFILDRLDAVMDSASRDNYYAFPYELKLDDQLFKYGIRINQDLVQDKVAGKYPVVIGETDNRPEVMQLEWPYFPVVTHYANHPITRNLDATLTRFVSSIDTVKAIGVKKTPLLFSSNHAHKAAAPVKVDINELRKDGKFENFKEGPIPLGYLLEGEFVSLYKNRFLPSDVDTGAFLEKSKPTKIIVMADGDVARNEVNPRTGQPQALGFDPFSGYTFANQDLLQNMVSYLIEDDGLITTRSKEVKIRLLDKEKVRRERSFWQGANIALPVVLLILFGFWRTMMRKRKYARF